MTGQKFIAFFFILHLPREVKGVTVGSEFEGKGEDVTVKLLSLLRIKIYSGREIFVLI